MLCRMLKRLAPLRDYVLNHVVNRIPLAALRMRAYKAFGVRLADHRSGMIMLHTEIWAPRRLEIGAHYSIGSRCVLDARGGITIGDVVNIGSGVTLQTAKHLVDSPTFASTEEPISVGDHAWIAEGARVLGGVAIGEGAVVTAGAVVTSDVAPFTVAGGVPARYLRDRTRDLQYRHGYRRNFV
jgi:maltose O-acetyltransferase